MPPSRSVSGTWRGGPDQPKNHENRGENGHARQLCRERTCRRSVRVSARRHSAVVTLIARTACRSPRATTPKSVTSDRYALRARHTDCSTCWSAVVPHASSESICRDTCSRRSASPNCPFPYFFAGARSRRPQARRLSEQGKRSVARECQNRCASQILEHSIRDVRRYAKQSGSLANRETQPRHLPVLASHANRERRHRIEMQSRVARAGLAYVFDT
jgi:hypothetical protein